VSDHNDHVRDIVASREFWDGVRDKLAGLSQRDSRHAQMRVKAQRDHQERRSIAEGIVATEEFWAGVARRTKLLEDIATIQPKTTPTRRPQDDLSDLVPPRTVAALKLDDRFDIVPSRTVAALKLDDPGVIDDAIQLRAVAADDQVAFKELYDRHAPWLRERLRHRCPDSEVVEDVMQETFVAVWRSAGRWRGEGEVAAWIWGIAKRRLLDALRLPSKIWAATQVVTNDVFDGWRDAKCSAEDELLRNVGYSDLGDALRKLSPELRDVVQARLVDGFTTGEAARLLGVPPGTVQSRLWRALQQLRDELAAHERSCAAQNLLDGELGEP
jgi:RNA polymerase sigma-70 factor, ECF subfamily